MHNPDLQISGEKNRSSLSVRYHSSSSSFLFKNFQNNRINDYCGKFLLIIFIRCKLCENRNDCIVHDCVLALRTTRSTEKVLIINLS